MASSSSLAWPAPTLSPPALAAISRHPSTTGAHCHAGSRCCDGVHASARRAASAGSSSSAVPRARKRCGSLAAAVSPLASLRRPSTCDSIDRHTEGSIRLRTPPARHTATRGRAAAPRGDGGGGGGISCASAGGRSRLCCTSSHGSKAVSIHRCGTARLPLSSAAAMCLAAGHGMRQRPRHGKLSSRPASAPGTRSAAACGRCCFKQQRLGSSGTYGTPEPARCRNVKARQPAVVPHSRQQAVGPPLVGWHAPSCPVGLRPLASGSARELCDQEVLGWWRQRAGTAAMSSGLGSGVCMTHIMQTPTRRLFK